MKRTLFIIALVALFASAAYANHFKQLDVIDKAELDAKISSHEGKTVVVFWAPWCPHCMREMRTIRDNIEFFGENGLQIIGLSRKKDQFYAAETVETERFGFPVYTADDKLFRELNPVGSVPVTIVFTPDGAMYDREWGAKTIADVAAMVEDF